MKIYMKQIPPECQDSLPYIDFDDQAKEMGVNIEGGRHFQSFLSSAYERAQKAYEDYDEWTIEHYYDGKITEYLNGYLTKKNGKKFSTVEASKIKKAFESGDYFVDIAAEVLTITEGEKYVFASLRGCCQDDCVDCVLPEKYENDTEYYASMFFNTGDEYQIRIAEDDEDVNADNFTDGGDVYCDYFTEWREDDQKKRVAEEYGLTAADVTMFKIAGQYTAYRYAVA